MSYRFVEAAEAEYLDAIRFFENQRAGLGAALLLEFEALIVRVVERPAAWKLVHDSGIRRAGLSRFPYAVFFRMYPEGRVEITAFAHHRRKPGYWAPRVSI